MTITTPESRPLVSVCIQTYQHVDFIRQCLDGVVCQKTSFPYEILLGEDASNDNTREICMQYAATYPDKIRLYLNDRKNVIYLNGIPTGCFNLIQNLNNTRGKYIALCEGDDYWTDESKLESQVRYMEKHSDCSLTFHDVHIEDCTGTFSWDTMHGVNAWKPLDRKDFYIEDLIRSRWFMATASLCFRRSAIMPLPDWLRTVYSADYALQLLALRRGCARYLDAEMAAYRIHDGGLSRQFDDLTVLNHRLHEIACYNVSTQGRYDAMFRDQRHKFQRTIALKYAQDGRFLRAARHVAELLLYRPKATLNWIVYSMKNRRAH